MPRAKKEMEPMIPKDEPMLSEAEKMARLELQLLDAQNKLNAAEKKVAAGEEAAMERVCKALNLDPDEITLPAERAPEQLIECHVPIPVNVNGTVYNGKVQVTASLFEVIQQAIGDRRTRYMNELTGKNYVLKQISGGFFAPRVVGKVNEHGEQIA